ncbi:MAG: hypothetical protein ABL879_15905, partial [Devosia sp.]
MPGFYRAARELGTASGVAGQARRRRHVVVRRAFRFPPGPTQQINDASRQMRAPGLGLAWGERD